MYLVFDTETTGKANFKLPPEHESQPRLVQLGAILYDKDFNVRSEANLIVKPEGFEIPKEASEVHGITTELATEYGYNEKAVLQLFAGMIRKSKVLVAHNIVFDAIIIGRGFFIHKIEQPPPVEKFCTMNAMTDVCKIPGPYGNKWPQLQEAYQYCFKEKFEGAHDAMADVRACGRIFRWLKEREKE